MCVCNSMRLRINVFILLFRMKLWVFCCLKFLCHLICCETFHLWFSWRSIFKISCHLNKSILQHYRNYLYWGNLSFITIRPDWFHRITYIESATNKSGFLIYYTSILTINQHGLKEFVWIINFHVNMFDDLPRCFTPF